MSIRTKTPHQLRVEDFMVKASQVIPDRPTVPDEKTRRLRVKLIIEEALETVRELGFHLVVSGMHDDETIDLTDKETLRKHVFAESTQAGPSLEGIADGCADIIVVTTGTLSACGIADDSVQREVDFNNLAKFEHRCPNCSRIYKDKSMPVNEMIAHVQPMTASSNDAGDPANRRCLCCGTIWQSGYHNAAGKWVKPANHKPPRIAEVLDDQAKEADREIGKAQISEATGMPECFGERYEPGSNACQGCPQRFPCVKKYCGA